MKFRFFTPGVFVILMVSSATLSAEPPVVSHSNGLGGGRWSDPGSWHAGKVPSATDHVVITSGDEILFDAGLQDPPNCAALSIDPRGVLGFRLDGDHHRLTVSGPIESYGIIRIDATQDRQTRATLRLGSSRQEDRVIRLLRGGALLLYGPEQPASDDRAITLEAEGESGMGPAGSIQASGNVMLDLNRVALRGVTLQASGIDNTGFNPSQRLNLINNVFSNGAGVELRSCDTAAIRKNRFIGPEASPGNLTAIWLDGNSLTACRENRIRGYAVGIDARNDVDTGIGNNRVSDSKTGIAIRRVQNVMVRDNHLSNCPTGVFVDRSSGVIDKLSVHGAARGIEIHNATLQVSDLNIASPPEDSIPLLLRQATVSLLNANIPAGDIRLEGNRPNEDFWVQAMHYLVVRVTGKVPERAVIRVRTAEVSGGVPEGRADLNVRNSPARLSAEGWTPMPRSRRPIVLRSWMIDAGKNVRDAPFYDLSLVPVVDKAEQAPAPLHHQVLEPSDDWFRADPDERKPTLEVNIP